MKKVLFATTALIATAGVASADIAISGDGRMGIVNTETATAGDAEAKFDSRLRFTLTASGVTDGGLSFGGSARIGVVFELHTVCVDIPLGSPSLNGCAIFPFTNRLDHFEELLLTVNLFPQWLE